MSKKTVLPSVLTDIFSPATRDWFVSAFQHPTPVQAQTWTATNAGEHVLAIAPTGSGKTLAAFLYALDQLFREGDTLCGYRRTENHAYPLHLADKSAGQRHSAQLTDPVTGHQRTAKKHGAPEVVIRVAMRTGDTSSQERATLVRHPPDILITTPESLYLMLTSRARETLRGVETVIVDEVHAVAGNKRGAHLALSGAVRCPPCQPANVLACPRRCVRRATLRSFWGRSSGYRGQPTGASPSGYSYCGARCQSR
jgi:ATP-dependent Lhr-like helicase